MMRRIVAFTFALLLPSVALGQSPTDSSRRTALSGLLAPVYYGIPTSPAFALLPNQPTEVANIATPKDFQYNFKAFHDGLKLRAGVAVDTRPFVASVGDLDDYNSSWVKRAMFRTILSAGTATAIDGTSDIIAAAGVRIPLIDNGDARGDPAFLESLSRAYNKALIAQGPPPFPPNRDSLDARAVRASAALVPLRDEYAASHWNALKLDVGFAGSVRAKGAAATSRDSLQQNRAGVWSAFSLPISTFGQVTIAGNAIWARADSLRGETSRQVAGARAVLFANPRLNASAEVAGVWSKHGNATNLDERWTHFGGIIEWYVPELKGWIGGGYGGDSSRRSNPGDRFAVHYAIYRDRVLK
ncbi:MAG: hypothetical protein M3081_02545 [Gemmatimonadota bacterium]|nr:hypothetical protein [Gemmatimonadota bacterium]